MSAGEASALDPQHRLLLELAYEGIENGTNIKTELGDRG